MIELIRRKDQERLAAKLRRIGQRNVALDTALMAQVAGIIDEVRARGDAALVEYTGRFDDFSLQPSELRVKEETLREFAGRAEAPVIEGLREAIARVRRFHEAEHLETWEIDGPNGVRLGQRVTAIDRVGVYVPGGTAAYPSSVVMNVVPAQVAGVEHIVVATPPRTLNENPAVAAALCELGIDEVYAVGGAQAVAALAYGTETVPAVAKITGPGNKYVAAAKKMVFGIVGIDSIAPEHLEIMSCDMERIAARIRNAGAIFFGDYSPEAVGDYLAGPNHVLPTARAARFSSALGVHDFIKRTNTVKFSAEETKCTARMIAALARVEGFEAHAQSTLIRLDE